jgi:prepilin peptidase CpaA
MDALAWIAAGLGCAAAACDLRRRTVSNWITAGGLAAGVLEHAWRGGGSELALSAGGAAIGFAAFLIFYWAGALGGGDLKLMAAFGALLGPRGILVAALLAAPIGGLLAAACLLAHRGARAIPYAPAIVLGAWLALLGRG